MPKRREVVLHRAAAASLEIDETGLTVLYHDVARLEVAVHEGIALKIHRILHQPVEIVLETDLVELEPRQLQEVVFEIVDVEIHHAPVELPVREAYVPVEALPDLELHRRQKGDRVMYPRQLLDGIRGVRDSRLQKLEELPVAQILLEVAHSVAGDGEYVRCMQPCGLEALSYREEGAVLGGVRPYAPYHGPCVTGDSVVFSSTARKRQQIGPVRAAARPVFVEFSQNIHS